MKKLFVTILVLVAISIYAWDTHLFLLGYFGKANNLSKSITRFSADSIVPHFSEVRFEEKGRSPFISFKQSTSAAAKSAAASRRVSASKTPIDFPAITVSGIMWNESNPVAIVNFADGSSIVAKPGQIIQGGITIKKIAKNQVEAEYFGKTYILKKL